MRPRGLEPPRTNQSTRPSTRITLCRYGSWPLKVANCAVFCTDWTPWTGWMLPRVLPRIWRQPTGKGGPGNFRERGVSTAQPSSGGSTPASWTLWRWVAKESRYADHIALLRCRQGTSRAHAESATKALVRSRRSPGRIASSRPGAKGLVSGEAVENHGSFSFRRP